MFDPINPEHYKSYDKIEVIDLTEQLNFNRGNVVKYVARAGFKGDSLSLELQDLQKAKWYLEREIARIQSIRDNCLICNTHGHTERPEQHDSLVPSVREQHNPQDTTVNGWENEGGTTA